MKPGISNPNRPISEIQIPKPNSIIVCGIFVLEEKRAATKIIIKNIGITYSRVSVFPVWLNTIPLLLVEAGLATVFSIVFVVSSKISAIVTLIL